MPLCPNSNLLLPDRYYTVVANAAARPTGADRLTGMMIYQVDVGLTYIWDGTQWIGGFSAYMTCTSSTRPVGPAAGTMIYETDTRRTLLYDGTDWVIMSEPVQTWAPAFTAGVTAGDGTFVASYHRSDGYIDLRFNFTLGSTSSVSGEPRITLPIAVAADANALNVAMLDNLTTEAPGFGVFVSGTSLAVRAVNTSGSYATQQSITSSIPWTWAANDAIRFSGRIRMASRYT